MKKFAMVAAAIAIGLPASAQFLVPIGTGSTLNTTTSYPAPYGNYWWGSRDQYVILASELTAAGVLPGPINSLAFDCVTANPVGLNNFTLGAGLTTATNASVWIAGVPTVFSSPNYVPAAGQIPHVFSAPLIWDGVSNVVVETCFNNASFTTNCIFNQSATSFVSARNYHADAAGVCGNPLQSVTPPNQRPNMLFDVGAISSPQFQTNQAKLSLKVNNTNGTAYVPTSVTQPIYACTPVVPVTGSITLNTTLLGSNWDVAVSPLPLVPSGLTLVDGQIVNMNLGGPIFFVNGAFASPFPSFPGATSFGFTSPFSFSAATDFSVQSVAIDLTAASTLRVSQATEYHAISAPPLTTIAGPTADTVGTLINVAALPYCFASSIPFYGVNYTQFYVQSNGRVTFGTSNTSALPTTAAAITAPASVGFWTDLNPALAGPGGLGSVNVTSPAPGLVSVNYNNVPYAGEPTTANSYQITFDATTGVVSLTGLNGIMPNPQTLLAGGDAQWLGICRGSLGSNDSAGNTTFAPGGSGSPSALTHTWRDYYLQVALGAGRTSSLVAGVGSILFIPSLTVPGNYDFQSF